jgi:hypothetical protein
MAAARRSVQPASSGRALSPWSARPGHLPRRRSPVRVHHVVSTQRFRRPVRPSSVQPPSGVQRVRCPARPVSGRPVSTRPVVSRLLSAPSVRTRPSPPTYGGGVRDQVEAARRPSPQERVEVPVAAAPSGGSVDSPGGLGAGDAAEVAVVSRGRWADPGRVGCGRRPRVTAERPGRPGRRAERPWLAAALWAREEAAARGGCTCRVAADPCWVGDHGAWWSWSLPPGWAGLEGPIGRVDGDGVRPRRGPG